MPMTFGNRTAELADTKFEAFSAEPEIRSIEIAFLRRVSLFAGKAAVNVLDAGDKRLEPAKNFKDNFEKMRSPVFSKLARALEREIPEDAGFGPFQGRK